MSSKGAVALVFVVAMFINIIDATVVNVALPTIAADLGVPVEDTATVNIGFLVAVAVAIPVAGWLGDRLGAREVFVVAVGIFTLASLACGLAGSVSQLVAFRIVQGLGGGLMTPVGMAMLYRTFPPAERVRLSRIITTPIALAPALGPVLGGLLVQQASWRWIFGINVPIGLFAVIFTMVKVPRMAKKTRAALDVPGLLLASLGFAGFMFAVSEGASRGWLSPEIVLSGVLGLAMLVAFVVVERRVRAPLLRLQLFAHRLFRSANIVIFASAAGFLGGLFVYPLMLQTAFGYSPLTAGLLTFPEAIGIMIGTQIAGRLYAPFGPRRIVAAGQMIVAAALITIAFVMTSTVPVVVPIALMVVLGLGQSHTFVPTSAAAFDTVEPEHTGAATALFNAFRQAGAAVGVAVAASVIAAVGLAPGEAGSLPAFRWALVCCGAFSIFASLYSMFTVHDEDAGPSRGLVPDDRTMPGSRPGGATPAPDGAQDPGAGEPGDAGLPVGAIEAGTAPPGPDDRRAGDTG